MQTIRFLPDRLNAEPVVFRGFTTPELGLAALIGLAVGSVVWCGVSAFFSTGWLGHHPDRDAAHAAATHCVWRTLDGPP